MPGGAGFRVTPGMTPRGRERGFFQEIRGTPPRRDLCTLRHLAHFTIRWSRASPRSSGRTLACPKRPRRGGGGLPAWEGGHPGRHAGWKPALLKEESDVLHSSVICSRACGAPYPPDRGPRPPRPELFGPQSQWCRPPRGEESAPGVKFSISPSWEGKRKRVNQDV